MFFLGRFITIFSLTKIFGYLYKGKGKKLGIFWPKSHRSKFDNVRKHHEKKLKLPLKTKAYGLSLTYSIKSPESEKWPHHNCQKSLFTKLMKIVWPSLMCSFALKFTSFWFLFFCLSCHNIPSCNGTSPSFFTSTMHITYPLASSPSFYLEFCHLL